MPTINATVFPDEAYVLVEVDWTDNPLVEYANVTRRNTVTGEIVTLRPYISYDAAGNLLLDCGLGLWWDTEPPLNVPLEYCTTAADVPNLLSQNSTFTATANPWQNLNGSSTTTNCSISHTGPCSLQITPNGTTAQPGSSQTVPMAIVAGVPVTLAGWVMSPQGWNGAQLQLLFTYSDGVAETISTDVEILDDNEWRFLTTTFTPRLGVIGNVTFRMITMGVPPNTTLFYIDDIGVYSDTAVLTTVCETVTVASESVWLKNPLHPCLDVEIGLCSPMLNDCEEDSRVSYAGTSTQTYAPNTVALVPANRRRIIPVNRIRRDAAATLRLIAHDCDAKDAVLAANEPGDPLLFQAPETYCIPDRYITVGTVEESHIGVDQRDDFRFMTLPYETVDRPEGPADGVCGARIVDLCDIYTSWGALLIAGLTWTDLLLGEASPNGPGQPEPPVGARTWDDVEAEFTDWDDVEAGGTRDWDELRDGL